MYAHHDVFATQFFFLLINQIKSATSIRLTGASCPTTKIATRLQEGWSHDHPIGPFPIQPRTNKNTRGTPGFGDIHIVGYIDAVDIILLWKGIEKFVPLSFSLTARIFSIGNGSKTQMSGWVSPEVAFYGRSARL